ncbi:MAG: hypothetical protein R6T99_11305 [Bacteroidales bacterium]
MKGKYWEIIQKYHEGELGPKEKETFEYQLKHDRALARSYREYRRLLEVLSDAELMAFRQNAEELMQRKYGKKRPGGSRNLFYAYWPAAAAFIIVAVLIFFLRDRPGDETAGPDPLAADSLHPKPAMQDTFSLAEGVLQDTGVTSRKEVLASAPDFSDPAYQIPAIYRGMIGNVYRNNFFRLDTPRDSAVFELHDDLVLHWESQKHAVYLDAIDHSGTVALREGPCRDSLRLPAGSLAPGAYVLRFHDGEAPLGWRVVFVLRD